MFGVHISLVRLLNIVRRKKVLMVDKYDATKRNQCSNTVNRRK